MNYDNINITPELKKELQFEARCEKVRKIREMTIKANKYGLSAKQRVYLDNLKAELDQMDGRKSKYEYSNFLYLASWTLMGLLVLPFIA